MIEAYRASEMIADFAGAVRNAKTLEGLETVGRDSAASIERHRVRDVCQHIYKVRRVELLQSERQGGME